MVFNSIQYLIFLPVVLLVNYLLPKKVRYLWLLVASYYFYMCWNANYALLILFSTAVTYLCAIIVEKSDTAAKKKTAVALSLVINLGILFFFKYFNLTMSLASSLLGKFGIVFAPPKFDVLLPVGISFYTFQALGYTIDVYRNDVKAQRNFFKYALFVSFFPQLVAGPIERSGNLMHQLETPKDFSYESAREGLLLMIWGFFLKMVIADRIAVFVDTVFNAPDTFMGFYVIAAAALFALQIYCDFGGYSIIAMGSAKMLGINLMENFDAPYLSTTVANFWRRWHISLTTWFRDYLYIPLGGNRLGTLRTYFNKIFVFFVSGIWHGAGLSYIVWGTLNGVYQVTADILMPVRKKIVRNPSSVLYKAFSGIFTFCLVDFAWIFFRAETVTDAVKIIRNIPKLGPVDIFSCGLNRANVILLAVSIAVLTAADIFKLNGIVIRDRIIKSPAAVRIIIIAVSVCLITLFGIWGPGYDAANFIYFQF